MCCGNCRTTKTSKNTVSLCVELRVKRRRETSVEKENRTKQLYACFEKKPFSVLNRYNPRETQGEPSGGGNKGCRSGSADSRRTQTHRADSETGTAHRDRPQVLQSTAGCGWFDWLVGG